MTVEELRRAAAGAMASIKTQIEETRHADPVCLIHWPLNPASTTCGRILNRAVTPGEWSRFPFPGQLLDSGDAKRILFQLIRDVLHDTGADGVLFGTDIWAIALTEEGSKHQKEVNRHIDTGFAKLVRMGWAVRTMAIHITAQSPTDVVLMNHEYQRTSGGAAQWLHETHTEVMPQAEFGGRQKMWGVLTAETLGEPPEGSPAERHQKGRA